MRYYWADSTNTVAIWYDGQIGADFDWIVSGYSHLGTFHYGQDDDEPIVDYFGEPDIYDSMWSNEETVCPHEVAIWRDRKTGDDPGAIVTCGKLINLTSGP